MVNKALENAIDFDPNETPTRKYRAGKIRDRNLTNIVKAAEKEFVQHGYRGASIQAIADRAAIPKANVHYYFKSKSNLYIAVLDNLIHLWNNFFNEITEKDDPATVLDELIRKNVEFSYTHPRASKLFAMEIIQGAPHLKDYIRPEMRQWVRRKALAIDTWVEAGPYGQSGFHASDFSDLVVHSTLWQFRYANPGHHESGAI
ncbi:TetR family transcriptional regulator C-terminal domain-containing protein [Marinimicrobium sp. C2-29]|uniref:TetR family transcriptional regulator C-terminal domain-containing protein n=1 Tax=Marinimicrobium sp. C2-29 TaxID=3139825 RepID=UPI00313917DC